jgi:hypothetical protein
VIARLVVCADIPPSQFSVSNTPPFPSLILSLVFILVDAIVLTLRRKKVSGQSLGQE